MPRVGIALQRLLDEERQAWKAAPHISVAGCEPDAYTGGNGAHARSSSAAAMRFSTARSMSAPTRKMRPFTSTTSIMPFALERPAEGSALGAEAVATAGGARAMGTKAGLCTGSSALKYLIQR